MSEADIQPQPPIRPSVKKHPIAHFNANAAGQNPDWHAQDATKISEWLKPTNIEAQRCALIEPGVIKTDEYIDPKTGQKLNTVWIHKEKAEQSKQQPVVLFFQGIGVHLSHPDTHANGWQLSHALNDAPVFMVDYPNVPDASGLTKEQKHGLKHDDASPILRTWIDAMKEKEVTDREVYITGESMGGFYALEMARYLAAHPGEGINVSKLHILDPAGIHRYRHKIEALDAVEYMRDFLSDSKNAGFYHENLANELLREVGGHNVSKAQAARRDLSWLVNRLARERPPIFYYGSILAHGGLPEKLKELMGLNPTIDITVTNFTNSKVCPHNECAAMVKQLNAEFPGRLHAQYLPGDAHAAVLQHDRLAFYSGRAFYEPEKPHNPELIAATRRITDALSARIYKRYTSPESPHEKLDYHNIQHTNQVRQGGRLILDKLFAARQTPVQEREHMYAIFDIAASAHDVVQTESPVPDKGDNEHNSIDEAVNLMEQENTRANRQLFTEADIAEVKSAIEATIPEFNFPVISQPNLTEHSSLITTALAVADLYTPYTFGTNNVLSALFREQNPDIKDMDITDPNIQNLIRNRMDQWIESQKRIRQSLQDTLSERLKSLSEPERIAVVGLMKFGESGNAFDRFEKRHHASQVSFHSLLELWEYLG